MDELSPTGLTRRRRRLSDEETEQRTLQAAMAMVNRTGLTVSLEHISFEDVIRDAGVARSAVYRRWPYKDLFFSDLLRELAKATSPTAVSDSPAGAELVKRIVAERLDGATTPRLRHELIVELLRQTGLWNFQAFDASTEWRTYLAVHATFLSLPPGELRDDVQAALAQSEQRFNTQIAASYEHVSGLLGYRLRPELNATFDTMASLLNATLRGLILMAPSIPDITTRRVPATPFGAQDEAEWSQPALAIAGIALSFLEPDPTVEWNDERRAQIHQAVNLPPAGWPGM